MPMSFDGHAASSSGCAIKPKVHGTGSAAFVGRTGISLRTGSYAMATAEHREPCDSRGSCTVLGAPRGESPLGDATSPVHRHRAIRCLLYLRKLPRLLRRRKAYELAHFVRGVRKEISPVGSSRNTNQPRRFATSA